MRTLRVVLAVAALAAVTSIGPPAQAAGDCVSGGEYDQTHRGMSPIQVARLYDLYGNYIGDADGDQRRAYRTCWAPGERRVIVEFSYNTNDSVDWYVRDTPWS